MPKKIKAQDYIMWIGVGFYPTPESFITEAERLGVSKRVPRIPTDAIPYKSRFFLVHPKATDDSPGIIGFFTVTGYEVLVKDSEYDRFRELLKDTNIRPIKMTKAAKEPERGCGHRTQPGAVYAVAYVNDEDIENLEKLAKKLKHSYQLRGPMVVFPVPIPWNGRQYRGYKRFDSEEIGIPPVYVSKKEADMYKGMVEKVVKVNRASREKAIIRHIKEAIRVMHKKGQEVTPETVAERLGYRLGTVRKYWYEATGRTLFDLLGGE